MPNEFKKRVAYQIYPSSFCDSNNDGWGDLQGIISKLDYLKDLGIGMIWLSPIYLSPMDDMGYDIADYKKINPLFGTMEDFDELVEEAKKRDILIVMDLVINHTSTSHRWFKEAIKDPNSKYRNYYIIKKGTETTPPNNRDSCFSGKAWEKLPNSKDEYYLRLYCKTQADLNYYNEDVIKEVEDILKFWLDKGVYGFRCDVINNIYKSSFKDDSIFKLYLKGAKYYANQDGMYKVLKRFRTEVLDKYDTFLVGETGYIDKDIGNKLLNERCLDMFFEFDHIYADKSRTIPVIKRKFSAKRLMDALFYWQDNVPYIANYLENHDQLRSISRYGDENKYYLESGKLLALLLLSLKGTPFIYEGEEIGMLNYKNFTLEETNDIAARTTVETVKSILHCSKKRAWKMVNETINRDHARSPMQWSALKNGGFNSGHKTWLKVNENYGEINVLKSLNDKNSILNFYKKMIAFRNDNDVLKYGEFEKGKTSNKINYFFRKYQDKEYLILLNFSKKEEQFEFDFDLKLLISNYQIFTENAAIPPYFAGIFEVIK